jgi:predicted nucleic acid-binding protein
MPFASDVAKFDLADRIIAATALRCCVSLVTRNPGIQECGLETI